MLSAASMRVLRVAAMLSCAVFVITHVQAQAPATEVDPTPEPGVTLGCFLVLEGAEYADSVSLSDNFEISFAWQAGVNFYYSGGFEEVFRVARNVSSSSTPQGATEVEVGVALYLGPDTGGTRFHLVVAQQGDSFCSYEFNTYFISANRLEQVEAPNIGDCCEICGATHLCVAASYLKDSRECRTLAYAPVINTYPHGERMLIWPAECGEFVPSTDIDGNAQRTTAHPEPMMLSQTECCQVCEEDPECVVAVYATDDPNKGLCWIISSYSSTHPQPVRGLLYPRGNGTGTCSYDDNTDIVSQVYVNDLPNGLVVEDAGTCCDTCLAHDSCVAAQYYTDTSQCFPLESAPLINLEEDTTSTAILRAPGAPGHTCDAPSSDVSDVRIRVLDQQASLYTDGTLACQFTLEETNLPMANAVLETSSSFIATDGQICDFELRNLPRSMPTPSPSLAPTPIPSFVPTPSPSLAPTPIPSFAPATPVATTSPNSSDDTSQGAPVGSSNSDNTILWSAVGVAVFMTTVAVCLLLHYRCKAFVIFGKGKRQDDGKITPNVDVDFEPRDLAAGRRRVRVGSRSGSRSGDSGCTTDADSSSSADADSVSYAGELPPAPPPGYEEPNMRVHVGALELVETDSAEGSRRSHSKKLHSRSRKAPTRKVNGVHFKRRAKSRRRIADDVEGVRRDDLPLEERVIDVNNKDDDVDVEEQDDALGGNGRAPSSAFIDSATATDDEDSDDEDDEDGDVPLVFVDVDHVNEDGEDPYFSSSDADDSSSSVSTLFGVDVSVGGDSPSDDDDDDERQPAKAEVVLPLTAPGPKKPKKRVKKADPAKKQKDFDCDVCQTKIRGISNYLVHMREQHGKVRSHVCPHCDKVFTRKFNLQVHIKTHLDKRSNVCPTCGEGFNQKSNLKRHIERKHKKPLKCPLCEDRFTQPKDAMAHYRKAHPDAKPIEEWRTRAARKTAKNALRCSCKMKFGLRMDFEAHQAKCRVAKDVQRKEAAAAVETIADDASKAVTIDNAASKSRKKSKQKRHLKSNDRTPQVAANPEGPALEAANPEAGRPERVSKLAAASDNSPPSIDVEPPIATNLVEQLVPSVQQDSAIYAVTSTELPPLPPSAAYQPLNQLPALSSSTAGLSFGLPIQASAVTEPNSLSTLTASNTLDIAHRYAVTATDARGNAAAATVANTLGTAGTATATAVGPLTGPFGTGGNFARPAVSSFLSMPSSLSDIGSRFPPSRDVVGHSASVGAMDSSSSPTGTAPGNYLPHFGSAEVASTTVPTSAPFPSSSLPPLAPMAMATSPSNTLVSLQDTPVGASPPAENTAPPSTAPSVASIMQHLIYAPSDEYALTFIKTLREQHGIKLSSLMPGGRSNAAATSTVTATATATLTATATATATSTATATATSAAVSHASDSQHPAFHNTDDLPFSHASSNSLASHARTSQHPTSHSTHSEHRPSNPSASRWHQHPDSTNSATTTQELSHADFTSGSMTSGTAASHFGTHSAAMSTSVTDPNIFVSSSEEVGAHSPPGASSTMIAQPFVVPTSVSLPALTASTSQASVGNMSIPMSTPTHRRDNSLSDSLGRQYSGISGSGLAIQRQHSGSPSIADPTLLDLVQDPVSMKFPRRVDSFQKLSRAESLSQISDCGAAAAAAVVPHDGALSRRGSLSRQSDNITDPMSMGAYETSSALLTSVSGEPLLFSESSLPGTHVPSSSDAM